MRGCNSRVIIAMRFYLRPYIYSLQLGKLDEFRLGIFCLRNFNVLNQDQTNAYQISQNIYEEQRALVKLS